MGMILISEIPLNVNQLGDERFFYPGDILGTEKEQIRNVRFFEAAAK